MYQIFLSIKHNVKVLPKKGNQALANHTYTSDQTAYYAKL